MLSRLNYTRTCINIYFVSTRDHWDTICTSGQELKNMVHGMGCNKDSSRYQCNTPWESVKEVDELVYEKGRNK